MRTATLDLNSRGSFVDDLNFRPGIVMCRDALLHRSHEIQPASFDSEMNISVFYLFFLIATRCVRRTLRALASGRSPFTRAGRNRYTCRAVLVREAPCGQGQHPEVAQR